jgi:hypothetical protein
LAGHRREFQAGDFGRQFQRIGRAFRWALARCRRLRQFDHDPALILQLPDFPAQFGDQRFHFGEPALVYNRDDRVDPADYFLD